MPCCEVHIVVCHRHVYYDHVFKMWNKTPPDSTVQGTNIWPTWVLSAPGIGMLAPQTLLSGPVWYLYLVAYIATKIIRWHTPATSYYMPSISKHYRHTPQIPFVRIRFGIQVWSIFCCCHFITACHIVLYWMWHSWTGWNYHDFISGVMHHITAVVLQDHTVN